MRHILQRKLADLDSEDHRRFIELNASRIVLHLRCTRDAYQEYVDNHNPCPLMEAHWEILRFAVFPTAVAILKDAVTEYAKLTLIPGRDLSLLYGIPTRTCYTKSKKGIGLLSPPALDDDTVATDSEIQSLAKLVDEKTLLHFKDMKEGGGVFQFLGGGPFGIEDTRSIRNSWSLCALRGEITLPEWIGVREKIWRLRRPWTDGLVGLFASVQEELLAQWRALPADVILLERGLKHRRSNFQSVVVTADPDAQKRNPLEPPAYSVNTVNRRNVSPNLSKPGRKPKLPGDFILCAGSLWRKATGQNKANVSTQQLKEIAAALDSAQHLPPGFFLEGRYGDAIRSFNSHNANSKSGPVKTWSKLVSYGDKDHLRGMRRLLSRCAEMLDEGRRGLSGN